MSYKLSAWKNRPPRHWRKIAAVLLASSFIFSQHSLSFADVSVTPIPNSSKFDVKAENSSIGEIAIKLTDELGMELSGEIDSDAIITTNLSGDLKEILAKILGKNNFLLEYTGEKPSKLVVLGVNDNPPGLVTAAVEASPIPVEPTATTPQQNTGNNNSTGNTGRATQAEYNNQLIAVSKLQAQQFGGKNNNQNPLDPNKSIVDANGNLVPEAAKALTQNSTRQLQELVKALKQLCPPGQKC